MKLSRSHNTTPIKKALRRENLEVSPVSFIRSTSNQRVLSNKMKRKLLEMLTETYEGVGLFENLSNNPLPVKTKWKELRVPEKPKKFSQVIHKMKQKEFLIRQNGYSPERVRTLQRFIQSNIEMIKNKIPRKRIEKVKHALTVKRAVLPSNLTMNSVLYIPK